MARMRSSGDVAAERRVRARLGDIDSDDDETDSVVSAALDFDVETEYPTLSLFVLAVVAFLRKVRHRYSTIDSYSRASYNDGRRSKIPKSMGPYYRLTLRCHCGDSFQLSVVPDTEGMNWIIRVSHRVANKCHVNLRATGRSPEDWISFFEHCAREARVGLVDGACDGSDDEDGYQEEEGRDEREEGRDDEEEGPDDEEEGRDDEEEGPDGEEEGRDDEEEGPDGEEEERDDEEEGRDEEEEGRDEGGEGREEHEDSDESGNKEEGSDEEQDELDFGDAGYGDEEEAKEDSDESDEDEDENAEEGPSARSEASPGGQGREDRIKDTIYSPGILRSIANGTNQGQVYFRVERRRKTAYISGRAL